MQTVEFVKGVTGLCLIGSISSTECVMYFLPLTNLIMLIYREHSLMETLHLTFIYHLFEMMPLSVCCYD